MNLRPASAGPLTVSHTGQLPSVTISFNLKRGFALGDAVSQIEATAASTLPSTVSTRFQGTAQAFQDSLVNLPRGLEREIVRDRDREYTLRGSESRTLATVGAFRVVSSHDLRDDHDRPADPRSGDLRHLREQGLVETARVPGYRDHAVVLTKEGRSLLESHRERDHGHQQTFYDGLKRERELEHDVQVYRAYERDAERLHERGARIERVILDYELRREYQKWPHERDRDRNDYDGHPDRTAEEIRDWALEHDLPYFDDEVHFPDLRIDYQQPDGRWDHDDIEVTTEHYRGAHAASVARSGFTCYGAPSALPRARDAARRRVRPAAVRELRRHRERRPTVQRVL